MTNHPAPDAELDRLVEIARTAHYARLGDGWSPPEPYWRDAIAAVLSAINSPGERGGAAAVPETAMGVIIKTPEMEEYQVDVRRESFSLQGEDDWDEASRSFVAKRHGIFVYGSEATGQGVAELLIEDIPKIRASLDAVEAYIATRG